MRFYMESEPDFTGERGKVDVAIALKLNDQTFYIDERFMDDETGYADITKAEFEERLSSGGFEWLSVRASDGNAAAVGQMFY